MKVEPADLLTGSKLVSCILALLNCHSLLLIVL